MNGKFYDKVAKKFGSYSRSMKILNEFSTQDSELVFKETLISISGKNKNALDVGCADGHFTLEISEYFKNITGIDISKEMLKVASKNQEATGKNNVTFLKQSVFRNNLQPESFDVIYNRRGPTNYPSFYSLLKAGGYYLEIGIGENDCRKIKEIFGRGQGFKKWGKSTLQRDIKELKKIGFKIVMSEDYFYNEYYPSYNELDVFLQGVPIFEDFDSVKDKKFLQQYQIEFQDKKGIKLPRHRIVVLAKKSINLSIFSS